MTHEEVGLFMWLGDRYWYHRADLLDFVRAHQSRDRQRLRRDIDVLMQFSVEGGAR